MSFRKKEKNRNRNQIQDQKGKEDIQIKNSCYLSQKAIENLEISAILFEEWDNKDKKALVESMAMVYDIGVPIKFVGVIEGNKFIKSRCSEYLMKMENISW